MLLTMLRLFANEPRSLQHYGYPLTLPDSDCNAVVKLPREFHVVVHLLPGFAEVLCLACREYTQLRLREGNEPVAAVIR